VPLGSTEQHGPFLPLGTDSYIQDALNAKIERQLPEIIFLPTIRIAASEEHKGFRGTVWIKEATLYAVLKDICSSLRDTASEIIFISAHGGNVPLLNSFVRKERTRLKPPRVFYFHATDKEVRYEIEKFLKGPKDDHAGNIEISTMLALRETLVSIPKTKYPKHKVKMDWQKDFVIDKSPDGIVDNHPNWIVRKSLGRKYLSMKADVLSRKIKSIL
jgi:creatinine amidohydrolase